MKETRFKQTEIGLIPEDWICVNLETIGGFSKGKGISRSDARTGIIPAIRYGEIYTDHNEYIKSFKSFISEDVAHTSVRLRKHQILFTCSGETKEDIAKAVAFLGDGRAYVGGDIIILTPKIDCDSLFLGYICNIPEVNRQKSEVAQGDAVVHISTEALKKIRLVLPPVSEQQNIAKALSDMDALLAELDKLIAKKRLIKQGAMQQLLTGRTRLKGFNEPWKTLRLQECLTIGNGRDYSYLSFGNVPVFGTGGIMCYVNKSLYEGETVCIGRKGTINQPLYHKGCIWTVDTLFYTHSFIECTSKFIYYLFCTIDWYALNEATGVPSLQKTNIYNLEVSLPPLQEQRAIASILTDMDNEISELEKKKVKYEKLKQGMMQQLLTGRIRLIS